MHSSKSIEISGKDKLSDKLASRKLLIIVAGIGIVLIITILCLSIATLAKVNESNHSQPPINPTSTPNNPTLVTSVRIEEAMGHLKELQRIATASSGTRAINTLGFNQTLDYITDHLTINTDYKIHRTYFPVRDFALNSDPVLVSSIDDTIKDYTYSSDLSVADFYYVRYSTSANFSEFVELTVIPNVACTDADWMEANPPPQDRVALVKRGSCPFRDKVILAAKYKVSVVLLYNDRSSSDLNPPIEVSLAQNNTVPALFLSLSVAQTLVDASQDASKNATVRLVIDAKDLPDFPVGNICADTPTGNNTQTIVIGSHSDSVPAGPGINDNGEFIL